MTSERIQRRIEGLLDEADAAIDARDWELALERAETALAFDPDNADARGYVDAARRQLDADGDSDAAPSPSASASAPAAPTHPSTFAGGRYRVERFLGEGGKKRVFLAHDTTLDRDVAFGQFRTEGMDAAGRGRVTQEAQAMGRVGAHPNLVNIYDIGEDAGAPFIVQEYVPGGSLADLIAEEPPPLAQTLQLAQDVCSALSFIHGQNLVHRDIKPSNVFLTEDGSAKVGDFGLAVGLDRTRITMQGGMIGTPSYMPPEQALSGDVTPQSDLYSLGAMLYELVTGRPPFVGDDPTSVISQHINTPPVAPSWHSEHCPPSLEALILALLEKDPSKRPASAGEVASALAAVDPDEGSARHSGSGDNPLEGLARGVFVGRESELERLRSAFDEAFAGRGSVVMLVGEPGIGKTRTTQELETYARMRGARVLWGRAHEASGAPAYWPWIQVGNHHARFVPPGDLAPDLDQSQVDELGRIFPALQAANPQPITDPAAAQFRLFDAYTAFMRAGSERAPLVIVLDDLHWADAPSLLLLQHMARELPRMRILVIGTFRDTDLTRTHPLSNALAELNREGGTQRVVLRGLSEDEVASYIRAVAGSAPAPSLVRRIYEETEGNPFFLAEVVNLMVQEGGFAAGANVIIPDGVREAIGRRLNLLSEEANELLTTAAVVGREFPFDTLALLFDGSNEELVGLINEGLRARVIEELEQPGRYQFTHAQMQETLLAEISTTSRVHLNARIADALEERYGDQAEARASRLARHFFEASTLSDEYAARALRYGRLAAERAEEQAGWAEAARRYEDCLSVAQATEGIDDETRAALFEALGRSYVYEQQFRPAWRALLSSIDLYRGLGDRNSVARATLMATTVPSPGSRLVPLVNDALEHSDAVDTELSGELRLIRSGNLARTLLTEQQRAEDEAIARRTAEEGNYPALLARLKNVDAAKAYATFDPQEIETSAMLWRDAATAFDALGQGGASSNARYVGAWLQLCLGNLEAAAAAIDDLIAYCRRVGARFNEHNGLGLRALVKILRGDLDGASSDIDEVPPGTYVIELTRALIAERQSAARLADTELAAPALAGGVPGFQMQLHGSRARALFLSGRAEQARTDLELWSDGFASGQLLPGPPAIPMQAAVGPALAALGTEDDVRQVYEILKTASTVRVTWASGADEIRGALALRLGLIDEAEQHFRTGIEWAEQEGCPTEAARCRQGLAEVAARRGDRATAITELDAAQAVFTEHGNQLYLDQVLAKKLEIQGAAGSDSQTSLVSLTTSIEEQRPDVASAVAPDGTVTLLFSDIEDSTAINVELGDDAWMQLLGEHNRVVRDAIRANGGFEVKTEGDAFMVAFQSARDAVRCAQAMQRALDARTEQPRLRIRIGLHTGEPVREADDFYGTHVVLASRICSQAGGGEILVSSLLRDLVASSGEFELTAREPAVLKGLDGEHVTYAVGWA